MSTSTTSGCLSLAVGRKGGRVDLRVDDPAPVAAGRLSDPFECREARPVLSLLKADQVGAMDAAGEFAELVVR